MSKKRKAVSAGVIEAKLELIVNARQQRVWDALVSETTHWWPKTFYSSERTKKFLIEPRLGGRVFEDHGKGEGFVWYTVTGVESPSTLQLVGHMGPPFGGPLASVLRLTLTPEGANQTRLEVSDACFGDISDCDTESGWREIFDVNFRPYVEEKKGK
ncbi:MAG TPA: hypothetical protein VF551_04610 [Chthoniobacterales bacterium]|jgi:hypothetical protein